MIDTREELVNALSEAAELEHGLLAQYLFAAFSMKKREDEGINPRQQALISDWEATILQIAHQEMYHLASVCNLLSAIGGAPQFARPNFPQPMKRYYPFDFTSNASMTALSTASSFLSYRRVSRCPTRRALTILSRNHSLKPHLTHSFTITSASFTTKLPPVSSVFPKRNYSSVRNRFRMSKIGACV